MDGHLFPRPVSSRPHALRARAARLGRLYLPLLLVVLLTGCAVKLAPDFDRTIVDGLTKANAEALTLFAGVAHGGDPATFAKRDGEYQKLVGKFDALRLQTIGRPTPQPPLLQLLVGRGSEDKTPAEIKTLKAPTTDILVTLIKGLNRMWDTDRKGTLTAAKVVGFKNSYEISITQALTYEKALER